MSIRINNKELTEICEEANLNIDKILDIIKDRYPDTDMKKSTFKKKN